MTPLQIAGLCAGVYIVVLAALSKIVRHQRRQSGAMYAVAEAVRVARAARAAAQGDPEDIRVWALELEEGLTSDEIAQRRRALSYLADSSN